MRQSPKMEEIFDKYRKWLSEIDAEKAKMAAKAKEEYSKVKDESITENVSERLVTAANIFVNQYANKALRNRGIESILGNIQIFKS